VKTIEARSKRTNKNVELVHIYAALQRIDPDEKALIAAELGINVDALPQGVLVGTVESVCYEPSVPEHSQFACSAISETTGGFAWPLKNPRRISEDLIRNIHEVAPVAELDGDELGYLLGRLAETKRRV
jgi:hypothetical protein